MEKVRFRLSVVMLKVRSVLYSLLALLVRTWATKLEMGLFLLMVMFMGRFSSTGLLLLMFSIRIFISIWGKLEEEEKEEVKEEDKEKRGYGGDGGERVYWWIRWSRRR